MSRHVQVTRDSSDDANDELASLHLETGPSGASSSNLNSSSASHLNTHTHENVRPSLTLQLETTTTTHAFKPVLRLPGYDHDEDEEGHESTGIIRTYHDTTPYVLKGPTLDIDAINNADLDSSYHVLVPPSHTHVFMHTCI